MTEEELELARQEARRLYSISDREEKIRILSEFLPGKPFDAISNEDLDDLMGAYVGTLTYSNWNVKAFMERIWDLFQLPTRSTIK